MKDFLVVVVAVFGVMAIVVGGFYLNRTVNFNLFYKSAVEQIVCEMVEPEALKVDCDK